MLPGLHSETKIISHYKYCNFPICFWGILQIYCIHRRSQGAVGARAPHKLLRI